jgi:sigma-B regulation protein RsbU (phosphoserine phosphatase)
LAFFLGDVSGKGMPAALFMIAVRTLGRHLAHATGSPAETLRKLNDALAADNPSAMFVTLAHGIYDPRSGEIVLASGGHPAPLIRGNDGQVKEMELRNGRLLGYQGGDLGLADFRLQLASGETLIFYTDGFTEAHPPDSSSLFGIDRLKETLGGSITFLTLENCAEHAKNEVQAFVGGDELQDDLTMLLLRRG